jgi:hypothetical protein
VPVSVFLTALSYRRHLEQGVGFPKAADLGYYTGPSMDDQNSSHQYSQTLCEAGSYCVSGVRRACRAGVYGETAGLWTAACTDECAAGYFCPPNSTSATERQCGSVSVYCARGSERPRDAMPGLSSCGRDASLELMIAIAICDWHCVDGLLLVIAICVGAGEYTVGPSNETRWGVQACHSGSYCWKGVSVLCPAGRFGCAERLGNADCNGPCSAGYYCPAGSVSNQQHACGESEDMALAATFFCPEGSGFRQVVGAGNYSTGSPVSSPHLRTGQEVCPAGTYCEEGVMVSLHRIV